MELRIDPRGRAFAIYDEIIDLSILGQVTIQRASHVEPDEHALWWADLSPVNGPKLGPFRLRTDALVAERDWLETHWLPGVTASQSENTQPS